jgi:hypothetical protein
MIRLLFIHMEGSDKILGTLSNVPSLSGFTLTWWGGLLHQKMETKKSTTPSLGHLNLNTPHKLQHQLQPPLQHQRQLQLILQHQVLPPLLRQQQLQLHPLHHHQLLYQLQRQLQHHLHPLLKNQHQPVPTHNTFLVHPLLRNFETIAEFC